MQQTRRHRCLGSDMKFLSRVLGTWLLGLALVLIVIDGARSLAASQIATTSTGELWAGMHAQSLIAAQAWIDANLSPLSLNFVTDALLSWPGWAMTGLAGLLFLILGRQKRRQQYVETE